MQQRVKASMWERTRWSRYGFVAGLVVGVVIGWAFHGVFNFIFRSLIYTAVVIVVVALAYAWWRLRAGRKGGGMDPDRVTVTRTVVARPEGTREE